MWYFILQGYMVCFLQMQEQVSFRGRHGGNGKKRGEENLTKDTPPKMGFWTPPRTVRFPPPSGVSALFFLYKKPRQSWTEAFLEGSKSFRESMFSGTFSSPHTFCTPPHIMAQFLDRKWHFMRDSQDINGLKVNHLNFLCQGDSFLTGCITTWTRSRTTNCQPQHLEERTNRSISTQEGQPPQCSQGEFQETLSERFRIFPEFLPESPSHTGGMAQFLRLWNAFKNSILEASKLVSTKTLLLKHYCRRQGKCCNLKVRIFGPWDRSISAEMLQFVRGEAQNGESPNFRWIPSGEPNKQSNRLKALLRGGSLCPSAVRRGSECGWGGCPSTVLLLT